MAVGTETLQQRAGLRDSYYDFVSTSSGGSKSFVVTRQPYIIG